MDYVSILVFDTLLTAKLHLDQFDTTYQNFYPEQRIEFYSLNNVYVLPNNTTYSVNSIRCTDIQQTYTAYSRQLNTAYLSSDTVTVELVDKKITMAEPNNYITATRKNFVSNDNEGRMVEKCIIEIQGTFLVKIRDDAFNGNVRENAFKHIDKFLKVVGPIKINGMTQDQFRLSLNNDIAKGIEEPWSENRVPYQLCDHICKPHRFKKGETKWSMCTYDIDGFCNGGKLPGMVRVRSITYFQDHTWYDELADRKLKDETLALKAKIEGSWRDATPGVMKFCKCMENFRRGPYANMKTKWTSNPYLDVNRIFGWDYDTQENQEHEEQKVNLNPEPSNCKIRRFEMMKYSFDVERSCPQYHKRVEYI
ncbi:hypothetical protein Tco_0625517 [Tanacetum coccineum]|uniref:Uncharacterized protein n=1 Tax=Tanacetum coccineum TaxID=301880 RepID=A0ABQ4WGZ7_9ASTR